MPLSAQMWQQASYGLAIAGRTVSPAFCVVVDDADPGDLFSNFPLQVASRGFLGTLPLAILTFSGKAEMPTPSCGLAVAMRYVQISLRGILWGKNKFAAEMPLETSTQT